MADVRVSVTDAAVISACNTPGGPVYEWRNDSEAAVLARAYALSPVNQAANARHRSSPPIGDFSRSWVTRRTGNQHRLGFVVENFSDHAIYVEEGRGISTKWQRFSWTGWGGDIRWTQRTRGYRGRHPLQRAVNEVGASTGSWGPV